MLVHVVLAVGSDADEVYFLQRAEMLCFQACYKEVHTEPL